MTTEETIVTWDDQGFADNDGTVNAYKAAPLTGEYMGPEDVWVSKGTGLPADIYLDAPAHTAPTGFTFLRDRNGNVWKLVEDHRGTTVYDVVTKASSHLTELGPIPDGKTDIKPTSPHDKWSGNAWVRDQEAEEQATLEDAIAEQAKRIAIATQQIAIITPAVDGGYAKPGHPQLLADWQRCRYELTLVPEQPGWPDKPQWPTEPEKVI